MMVLLKVKGFANGQEIEIGVLDRSIHQDVRTIVDWLKVAAKDQCLSSRRKRKHSSRYMDAYNDHETGEKHRLLELCGITEFYKRLPKLSTERIEAVENGLRTAETTSFRSLAQLCEFLMKTFRDSQEKFNADEYYNAERSKSYTRNCSPIQYKLTRRTLECIDLKTAAKMILDIGCGSGLCLRESLSSFSPMGFVIGFDMSRAMLELASSTISETTKNNYFDLVQADMKQALPFREGVIDCAFSVSSLQYLRNKDESDAFFQSTGRIMRENGQLSFQFFPNDNQVDLIRTAASDADFQNIHVMIDQTHQKPSKHWYLSATKTRAKPEGHVLTNAFKPPCCLHFDVKGAGCYLVAKNANDRVHLEWVQKEHIRHARRIIRLYMRNNQSSLNETEKNIAGRLLLDVFPECKNDTDVPTIEAIEACYATKIDHIFHPNS